MLAQGQPAVCAAEQVATTDPDGWKYVFVDHQDLLKELEEATGGDA